MDRFHSCRRWPGRVIHIVDSQKRTLDCTNLRKIVVQTYFQNAWLDVFVSYVFNLANIYDLQPIRSSIYFPVETRMFTDKSLSTDDYKPTIEPWWFKEYFNRIYKRFTIYRDRNIVWGWRNFVEFKIALIMRWQTKIFFLSC